MDSDEDKSGPMSEGEEENLDSLLSGTCSDSDDDEYAPPRMTQASSQSTCDSQSSQGSADPLFHNSHMYFWQYDSVADKDAQDPRTTQFKPKREPGIQLNRVSRGSSRNFTTPADFLQLFLTPAFLLNICIATNTYAKDCISKGQRMSYTQADGLWEDLTVEEITSPNMVDTETLGNGVSCQTEETLFSSIEMLALTARIRQLEEENDSLRKDIIDRMKHSLKTKSCDVVCQTEGYLTFHTVTVSKSSIKHLFQFYTGLTYARFLMLLAFLFPSEDGTNPITYEDKRKETHMDRFPLCEQVFMYLCRLRNGLHLKDLAFRFNIKFQTASTVVNSVAKYMYARLGSLSFWPHRDVIIENMPESYRRDFPTCLAILDCTEIKTEKPSSLKQQSQCYSDYKSSNTLKALVVCDPRGSILFISDLFSGSISDNDIIVQSGFLEYLNNLKTRGFIKANDNVMADKGFRIEKELAELEIGLNIPPFASSAKPFSEAEVNLTQKIASHRIHIERAINQIKCFKLLERRINISMFHCINAHWFNASILTNFQDALVKN